MFVTKTILPGNCKKSFLDASLEIISWLAMQGLDLSSDIYSIYKNK